MSPLSPGIPPESPEISSVSTPSSVSKSGIEISLKDPTTPLVGPPKLSKSAPATSPAIATANALTRLGDEHAQLATRVARAIGVVVLVAVIAALLFNPFSGIATGAALIIALFATSLGSTGAAAITYGLVNQLGKKKAEEGIKNLESNVQKRTEDLNRELRSAVKNNPEDIPRIQHQLEQMDNLQQMIAKIKEGLKTPADELIGSHDRLAKDITQSRETIALLEGLQQRPELDADGVSKLKEKAHLEYVKANGQLQQYDAAGLEKMSDQIRNGELTASDIDDPSRDDAVDAYRLDDLKNKSDPSIMQRLEKAYLSATFSDPKKALTMANLEAYQALKQAKDSAEHRESICDKILRNPNNNSVQQQVQSLIDKEKSRMAEAEETMEKTLPDQDHLLATYHSEYNKIKNDKTSLPADLIAKLQNLDSNISAHTKASSRWAFLKNSINHEIQQLGKTHGTAGHDRDTLALGLSAMAQMTGIADTLHVHTEPTFDNHLADLTRLIAIKDTGQGQPTEEAATKEQIARYNSIKDTAVKMQKTLASSESVNNNTLEDALATLKNEKPFHVVENPAVTKARDDALKVLQDINETIESEGFVLDESVDEMEEVDFNVSREPTPQTATSGGAAAAQSQFAAGNMQQEYLRKEIEASLSLRPPTPLSEMDEKHSLSASRSQSPRPQSPTSLGSQAATTPHDQLRMNKERTVNLQGQNPALMKLENEFNTLAQGLKDPKNTDAEYNLFKFLSTNKEALAGSKIFDLSLEERTAKSGASNIILEENTQSSMIKELAKAFVNNDKATLKQITSRFTNSLSQNSDPLSQKTLNFTQRMATTLMTNSADIVASRKIQLQNLETTVKSSIASAKNTDDPHRSFQHLTLLKHQVETVHRFASDAGVQFIRDPEMQATQKKLSSDISAALKQINSKIAANAGTPKAVIAAEPEKKNADFAVLTTLLQKVDAYNPLSPTEEQSLDAIATSPNLPRDVQNRIATIYVKNFGAYAARSTSTPAAERFAVIQNQLNTLNRLPVDTLRKDLPELETALQNLKFERQDIGKSSIVALEALIQKLRRGMGGLPI